MAHDATTETKSAPAQKAPWDKAQVKDFVRDVRKELGRAWDYMTPETRAAFIDAKVLTVVRAQHADSIDIAKVDFLANAMAAEAGLR